MKQFLVFACCFSLTFHFGIAQTRSTDSLISAIKDSPDDSVKVSALKTLSRDLWNQDRQNASIYYSNSALALGQKLNIEEQMEGAESELTSVRGNSTAQNEKSSQALDEKLEHIKREQDTLNFLIKEYEKRTSSFADDAVETARRNKEKIAAEQRATVVRLQLERTRRNLAIAAGIITAILLSLVFLEIYRRRQTVNKLQVQQLSNKVLRSQLNPHFIFHSLNSIRTFMEHHPEKADGYLVKFSTLMRQVLENSEEEKISLSEEIAMIENYMQLEALRIPNGFDYEVSIDESVDADAIRVPPLILQPMIENAIIHGLMPMKSRGKIHLYFKENSGLLETTIEDNGIGLGTAKIDTRTTTKKLSLGMQITRERIRQLNRNAKEQGSLVQQLLEQGSKVKMEIPV